MYHIIVMTHGQFAIGIKDTVEMILGKQSHIDFVKFAPGETCEAFREKALRAFCEVPENEPVLILTDLYGGTPNNTATELKIQYGTRVEVVSGINLPMLMAALSYQNEDLQKVMGMILEEGIRGIERLDLDSREQSDEDE